MTTPPLSNLSILRKAASSTGRRQTPSPQHELSMPCTPACPPVIQEKETKKRVHGFRWLAWGLERWIREKNNKWRLDKLGKSGEQAIDFAMVPLPSLLTLWSRHPRPDLFTTPSHDCLTQDVRNIATEHHHIPRFICCSAANATTFL